MHYEKGKRTYKQNLQLPRPQVIRHFREIHKIHVAT